MRADLLQRVGADVVVGHHQAVGRDERARAAAVEADGRRLLQVLEPLGGRLEAVLLLELLQRQVVEEPHALVGVHDTSRGQGGDEGGDDDPSVNVFMRRSP